MSWSAGFGHLTDTATQTHWQLSPARSSPTTPTCTRRAHDYPSAGWRTSYQRRTAAERLNASIKDTAATCTAPPPPPRCCSWRLHFAEEQPLIGWRLFRVRRSDIGFVLSAPLIHNPGFERFPSRTIGAICYQAEHLAPAAGCRCGLYAAIDGTLDSLPGYLSDSAHDRDPPIYAEVACTGRVFVDVRGVRAQRIEIIRLATPASLWPDPGLQEQAVAELSQRYCIEVCGLGVVAPWVVANVMQQGAPPEDAAIDLDELLGTLGLRSPRSR